MNVLQQQKLEELTQTFIDEKLDGRYREHVSDVFLKALMVRSCAPKAASIIDGHSTVGYEAVCFIFESILEYRCRAGGNGHHVAQSFQAFIEDYAKLHPAA